MKFRYVSIIILTFLMTSCVSIYFNQPQPVDRKDMKKAPSSLRGTWISGNDTTVIGKKTYYQSDWYIDTILKAVIDTTPSLKIFEGRIYDMEEDELTGYAFSEMDDQLIVYIPEVTEFMLSDSARLRKVSSQYFVFNTAKNGVWWEVFLLQKADGGSINIRYPKESDLGILQSLEAGREVVIPADSSEDNSMITNEMQKFWEVELTRDQMLYLIEQGGFADTVMVMDISDKQ